MAQQDSQFESGDAATTAPVQKSLQLELNKLVRGTKPVIQNPLCAFTYTWDFGTNEGTAELTTINGNAVPILLHPLGIAGQLDFMSDMKPTPYVINGQRVIIFRVILDVNPSAGTASAAIMFNQDGSCIQASENFDNQLADAE